MSKLQKSLFASALAIATLIGQTGYANAMSDSEYEQKLIGSWVSDKIIIAEEGSVQEINISYYSNQMAHMSIYIQENCDDFYENCDDSVEYQGLVYWWVHNGNLCLLEDDNDLACDNKITYIDNSKHTLLEDGEILNFKRK